METIETKTVIIYGALCVVLLAIMMVALADDLARVKRLVKPRLVWVNRDIKLDVETPPGANLTASEVVWDLDA